MRPPVLILHVSGANRDAEAARACELAGGAPTVGHINQWRSGLFRLSQFEMLVLPGGFSYGDALGAGVRQAMDLRIYFKDQIQEFVDSGKRVLGICNGLQTLVKAGLLPGTTDLRKPAAATKATPAAATRATPTSRRDVTLTHNERARFECRWVHLLVEKGARATCLSSLQEPIFCPVAHGEGNFQVANDETLARLEQGGLIAFRYVDPQGRRANGCYPLNPNGSVADIAGICNPAGNVVGLMPHPEDHIDAVQNPLGGAGRLGLSIFEAMIGQGAS